MSESVCATKSNCCSAARSFCSFRLSMCRIRQKWADMSHRNREGHSPSGVSMKCHDLPTAGAFSLANCTVPVALSDLAGDQGGEFAHVNMHIADGRIASIEKARPNLRPSDAIDVRGAMVFPCFVDLHSHLDKNHIWPRAGLTDGSFGAAIEAVAGDRARWTDREVRARMAFGIRCAYAHGTQAIRTHIDSNHAGSARDWEIFSALRDEWRGRVALQAVSIVSVAELVESGISESIADMVAVHGGVLGASTRPIPQLEQVIETLFDLAEARGPRSRFPCR